VNTDTHTRTQAAELCGDSSGGGAAAGYHSAARVKLAAGLASLGGGDLQSIVYRVLTAARVLVPIPIQTRLRQGGDGGGDGGGGGGEVGGGWDDSERFRAGVRAVAATMFSGREAAHALTTNHTRSFFFYDFISAARQC
jgi:hypothetical protein